MTTPERVNPEHKAEVLLRCARKAYPEYEWELINGMLFRSINPYAVKIIRGHFDIFDTSKGDQMALQIALEREGWFFGFKEDFGFMGSFDGGAYIDEHNAPTKAELLYTIVSQDGGG